MRYDSGVKDVEVVFLVFFFVGTLGSRSWGHHGLFFYPSCRGLGERKCVVGRTCLTVDYRVGSKQDGRRTDVIRCVHVGSLVQMSKRF